MPLLCLILLKHGWIVEKKFFFLLGGMTYPTLHCYVSRGFPTSVKWVKIRKKPEKKSCYFYTENFVSDELSLMGGFCYQIM